MSLDQHRVQLLVPGSVARNVRDPIKSLVYARLPPPTGICLEWHRLATDCLSSLTRYGPQDVQPNRPPCSFKTGSNPSPLSNAAGPLTIAFQLRSAVFQLRDWPVAHCLYYGDACWQFHALPASRHTTDRGERFTATLTISPGAITRIFVGEDSTNAPQTLAVAIPSPL